MPAKPNNLTTGLLLAITVIAIQSCASETIKITPPPSIIFTAYPKHTCDKKPLTPKRPGKVSSYKNIETYNLKISKYNINVEKYNKNIHNYKTCINHYIKNGNQDIDIIRKKLNSALKEARRKQL